MAPESTPDTRHETTARFMAALHALERDGSTADLVGLTSPDAEVVSIDGHGPRRGPDGTDALFSQYRAQFDRLDTTFTQVTEDESRAALEWRTEATLAGGRDVTYTGVTVVELGDDAVTGIRVCYDSGALLTLTPTTTPTSDD